MLKRVAQIMGSIAVVILLSVGFTMLQTETAKAKEISLGDCVISAYSPACNTPRGSRTTCTGAVARGSHTIAVDSRDPRVGYGAKLKVEGFGDTVFVVEDCGGFGRLGRDFDMFFETEEEVNNWGVRERKVWLIVSDEKENKAKESKKKDKTVASGSAVDLSNYMLHSNLATLGAAEAMSIHTSNHGITPLSTLIENNMPLYTLFYGYTTIFGYKEAFYEGIRKASKMQ